MHKILIVEDEVNVRENVAEILQSFEYEVQSAKDGKDALAKLEDFQPDLILSDIMMPVMDGFTLYKECKSIERYEDIPFIFLTAKSQVSDIRAGMAAGVEDYITKPFRANDLLGSVAARIEKHEKSRTKMNEVKNNIAKYIPHELRTPLISILGFSELVLAEQNTLERENILDMVKRIHRAGKRLHSLVEKFILFSDLQLKLHNPAEIERIKGENCKDFDKNLKSSVLEYSFRFERNDDIDISLEPVDIKGDLFYTDIVVKEIVENALKFSDPGTKIKITGVSEGEYYKISVADHGIGFPQHVVSKIDAFTQFNKNEMQQTGLGLGLLLSTKIAMMLDGRIEIDSNNRESTEVNIFLPKL